MSELETILSGLRMLAQHCVAPTHDTSKRFTGYTCLLGREAFDRIRPRIAEQKPVTICTGTVVNGKGAFHELRPGIWFDRIGGERLGCGVFLVDVDVEPQLVPVPPERRA